MVCSKIQENSEKIRMYSEKLINSFRDVLRIHSQPRVSYNVIFNTSRYNKNVKKIQHIKYVKKNYFAL